MTERHRELTRYLTFKPDKYAVFLAPHLHNVLEEIAEEPEGITFEDLLMKVSYKGRYMGPKLLRASLKHLFDKDYIITNHQMAALRSKTPSGLVDPSKLRVVSEETVKFDPKIMGGLITGLGEYREEQP